MRLQEFIQLSWNHIDLENRRITIPKSKTDKKTGRKGLKIVIPVRSQLMLTQLAASLLNDGRLPGNDRLKVPEEFHPPHGRVFMNTHQNPMTEDGFSSAFEDVCKRAKPPVKDLVIPDLRQTATTIFIKAELLPEERKVMKRETEKSMDSRHYQGEVSRDLHLQRIQDKLDRYFLKGKTLAEAEADIPAEFKLGVLVSIFGIDAIRSVQAEINSEKKASTPNRRAEEAASAIVDEAS
jgi:integrase